MRRRRFDSCCARRQELLERPLSARPSANFFANSALVEPDLPARDRRPEPLLVVVQVLGVDPLPLALDDVQPSRDVGVTGRATAPARACAAPRSPLRRRGRGCACTLAVEVGVEQRVQRDDALRVGRALRHEVDHHAGLLARVDPHDPPDPLLVDAARCGRREVHAHGRARRVHLREEHRVDEDVDLAALVGGEGLRQTCGRCVARDRLRLEPGCAEFLREVVRVLDSGRTRSRASRRSARGTGSRPRGSAPGGRGLRPMRVPRSRRRRWVPS
jgi:hypothetical protein